MRSQTTSVVDLPTRVPVFPLLGAILLPRAVLPLNIFEPRYLAMIDAALGQGRYVGIIQPEGADGGPTGSPQGRTASLSRVGCVGRITSFQEAEGGRYLIALVGEARFKPVREVDLEQSYRTFEVDYSPWANDTVPGEGEDRVDRDRLLGVLKRYLADRIPNDDWAAILESGSESLVNALSVASTFSPPEKQALVEAATIKERAATLVTLAEMALAAGDNGAGKMQ
jgi:uncharacterized protein